MFPRSLCSPALLSSLFLVPSVWGAELLIAPKPTDDRLSVELVAMEPDVRTPTSIATDESGRIWVLENNTHFRPKTYDAPPTDRVLVMEDFGPDGRARKITPWAEGFRDAMSLLRLPDGSIIVSTRAETLRLRDTDGDGRADQRTTLLKMETKDEYPHNGLSGLAMSPDGKIFLGLGENHGSPWVLTGSDGTQLYGSDEGAIFRFNPDGTGLLWWAKGVWNPFGSTFGPNNQLFTLDNDPSGGSLCRLLHVVPGGDYGYRYRYGRTIEHPFLSWFGQLPGTLPPVCLVGEAPCAILSYRQPGIGGPLQAERGELIGTTWNDHGLQRFPLTWQGDAYVSKPEWLVRGGNDFRPTGLAEAPDGSLLVSDWVDGAYEVHGKGRIWRIRAKAKDADQAIVPPIAATSFPVGFTAPVADSFPAGVPIPEQSPALRNNGPFVTHAVLEALASTGDLKYLRSLAQSQTPAVRLRGLLALRRSHLAEGRTLLPEFLKDSDGAIRRAALQWISEEGLKGTLPMLDTALDGQPTRATFHAYVAAIQMLTSGTPDPKATVEQSIHVALDPHRSPELRALALRLVPTTAAGLGVDKLRALLGEQDARIRIEAVRILAGRADDASQAELRRIAVDPHMDSALQAEALAGLARSAAQPETQALLRTAASSDNSTLVREAQRAIGTNIPTGAAAVPAAEVLKVNGDAAAGRRLFYHPNGPQCFTCHAVEGRGGAIGPDLTQMGRFTPEQLLQAIREPSKDIAPAYAQWHVALKDGTEAMGIDLFEDNKSEITLVDATGKKTKYKVANITTREVLPISLMPPGLDATLSTDDLRNLIAFLREARD